MVAALARALVHALVQRMQFIIVKNAIMRVRILARRVVKNHAKMVARRDVIQRARIIAVVVARVVVPVVVKVLVKTVVNLHVIPHARVLVIPDALVVKELVKELVALTVFLARETAWVHVG